MESKRSSTWCLSWLLLDIEVSPSLTSANSEMLAVNVDESFWRSRSWCYGVSGTFLWWLWMLFPCTAQALLKMDRTREYGICSSLSADEKYRDMKASWLKASSVEGALINMVALLQGDGCFFYHCAIQDQCCLCPYSQNRCGSPFAQWKRGGVSCRVSKSASSSCTGPPEQLKWTLCQVLVCKKGHFAGRAFGSAALWALCGIFLLCLLMDGVKASELLGFGQSKQFDGKNSEAGWMRVQVTRKIK